MGKRTSVRSICGNRRWDGGGGDSGTNAKQNREAEQTLCEIGTKLPYSFGLGLY